MVWVTRKVTWYCVTGLSWVKWPSAGHLSCAGTLDQTTPPVVTDADFRLGKVIGFLSVSFTNNWTTQINYFRIVTYIVRCLDYILQWFNDICKVLICWDTFLLRKSDILTANISLFQSLLMRRLGGWPPGHLGEKKKSQIEDAHLSFL